MQWVRFSKKQLITMNQSGWIETGSTATKYSQSGLNVSNVLAPSKNAASCTLERNSFPELVSPLLLSVGSDWSLPDNL